jgi:hypothetical protein
LTPFPHDFNLIQIQVCSTVPTLVDALVRTKSTPLTAAPLSYPIRRKM